MKPIVLSISISLAFACGTRQETNKSIEDPATTPAADQTSADDFRMSEQEVFKVRIVWNNTPVSGSLDNSAEVYLLDKVGEALTSSRIIRFRLYMITMGHPSIKEDSMQFTQADAGHWNVSRIYFSMGGPKKSWVVDLDAEANGTLDHVRVSIDLEVE